jgi:hypothetical protein
MSISTQTQQSAQRDLQRIPGVGPSIAGDLWILGYRSVAELRDENPEAMYRRLCELTGGPVDRCVLYVFRCAVYYASNDLCDPELLKWWNWSDQHVAARGQLHQ